MAKLAIIDCKSDIAKLIECRNNTELLQSRIIIAMRIPPTIKDKNIRKLLKNFKSKFTLNTHKNDNTAYALLIDKSIKTQKDWKQNGLLISKHGHRIILAELIDDNMNESMKTLIHQCKDLDSNKTIILSLVKNVKYERLNYREIETLIRLNQQNHINEDNQLKRAYTLTKKLNSRGFQSIIKGIDENCNEGAEKIICFTGKRLKDSRVRITESTINIELRDELESKTEDEKQALSLRIDKINENSFREFYHTNRELCRNWNGREVSFIYNRMNQLAKNLYEKLKEIQENVTTIRKRKTNSTNYNQTTIELINSIKETDKELRQFKESSSVRKKNMEDRREKLIENLIKEFDKSAFENKFNDDTNYTDDLWDRIKHANWILEEIDTDWTTLIEDNDQLDNILDKKFPLRQRAMQNTIEEITGLRDRQTPANCLMYINEQEVERAFYELRNKTYSGIEGIKFRIFIEAYKHTKNIIHTICKMSFHIGLTPENCRTTLGNLIPKKAANQFRIVHVSTPLASLLEQIALHRLEYRLEANNLYCPRQYGFTALKDRHDLILRVLNMIKEYEYKNKYGIMTLIGLDINGAFDNVDQDTIIGKLLETMPTDGISIWLANFILYRYIKVRYNELESNQKQIYMGIPQGSALGPILWNFTINTIDNDLRKDNELELLAYADDLILVHKSTIFTHDTTQNTLDKLIHKLETIKLDIRAEKCSTIIIRNSQATLDTESEINNHNRLPKSMQSIINLGTESTPQFNIKGTIIDTNDHLNILGVKINNNCTLKIDDEQSTSKLIESVTRLKIYKELRVTRNSMDWRILIDSLIKSRTIINNHPILAIDYNACDHTDKLMLNIYKQIFDWEDREEIDNTIRFIMNLHTTFETIKQKLLKKSAFEHATEAQRFIKVMSNNTREHNLVTTTDQADMHWNTPANEEHIRQDNNNSNSYTAYDYNKRRHQNPNKPINIMYEQEMRLEEVIRRRIVWTLISDKQGCTLTKYIGNNIVDEICIKHSRYTIDYFNVMATLWYLTNNQDSFNDKNLIVSKTNALILAIQNKQNHDWRVIELRERLSEQKWNIALVKDEYIIRTFGEEVRKESANNATTKRRIDYNQPSVDDYIQRYNIEQTIKSIVKRQNEALCPMIIKALEKTIPTETWQNVNPERLTTSSLLALSGYIKENRNSEWVANMTLQLGERWTGCNCIKNSNNIGYTTMHRLLECTRFDDIRVKIRQQLERISTQHTRRKQETERKHLHDTNKRVKEVSKIDKEFLVNKATLYLEVLTECAKGITI